jgi:hypothetical protein
MKRLRRLTFLSALVALVMTLGIAMPAQAATPKRPACVSVYIFGKDCSTRDAFDAFKKFSDSYVNTTDYGYKNSAIPAMMYAVFGSNVFNEKAKVLKGINARSQRAVENEINALNDTTPSNAKIICVRDHLLKRIKYLGARDRKITDGYNFLEWTTGTNLYKKHMKLAGVSWVGAYMQLVIASKGTTKYLGEAMRLDSDLNDIGDNCVFY